MFKKIYLSQNTLHIFKDFTYFNILFKIIFKTVLELFMLMWPSTQSAADAVFDFLFRLQAKLGYLNYCTDEY